MNKKLALLFDVDNTLLDNDRVTVDLKHHLEREIGVIRGAFPFSFRDIYPHVQSLHDAAA